jgi:TonB family protein
MKKTALLLITLVWVAFIPSRADVALNIKLNFFGPAAGKSGGVSVATSFYLKSMVQRNLQVNFAPETLLAELQKTFNSPGLALLSSGDLAWRSGGPASVMQIVQIDGRDYALVLTPLPKPGAVNFKVGVVEESDKKSIQSVLLDTEIVLPDGEVAMLGFRDSQEHSYFVAIYVQGRGQDREFARNAVRVAGDNKPKLMKQVNPVYPDEALKGKIEGQVILEVVIEKSGRVRDTRIIATSDPLLAAAAEEAVKQWIYEPYVINGSAKEVFFSVTVSFALAPESSEKIEAGNALTRLADSQKPKIIKMVRPLYPDEALENEIQGAVKLEAMIDEQGKVKQLRILSSPNILLNDAALNAVKQWVYEPYLVDGKAKSVMFNVTVTFFLSKKSR